MSENGRTRRKSTTSITDRDEPQACTNAMKWKRRHVEENTAESETEYEVDGDPPKTLETIRLLWEYLKYRKSEESDDSEGSVESDGSPSWGALCQEKEENGMIVDAYRKLYPDVVDLAETTLEFYTERAAVRRLPYQQRHIYRAIKGYLCILDTEQHQLEAEMNYPRAHRERDQARMNQEAIHPQLDALGRPKYLPIHPCQKKNERLIYYGLGPESARLKRRRVIISNREKKMRKEEDDLLAQEKHPVKDELGRRKYLPVGLGQRKSERALYWDLTEDEAEEERERVVKRHKSEAIAKARGALEAAYKNRKLAEANGTFTGRPPAYEGPPRDNKQLADRYPGGWFWLGPPPR
jgi:hypothetical protein